MEIEVHEGDTIEIEDLKKRCGAWGEWYRIAGHSGQVHGPRDWTSFVS